jgi:asparagine synthase (glutamine-hydrolysing)
MKPRLATAVLLSSLCLPALAQFQTPEAAIKYRQGAFSVMAAHFSRVAMMAQGIQPFDAKAATWDEEFAEVSYCDDELRNRMLNELFHEVVRVILRQDDLNSMTYSVENRSPFLDRQLFEFTATIPTALLIRDGWNKVVLRDAMDGIHNDQVRLSREKRGFNASITSLFDLPDAHVRRAFLGDSSIFDWFDRARIEAVLDSGEYPNSVKKFLFSFLSAKTFIDLTG